LTPCYGLEVHYPTQALKSVNDRGKTFNSNRKWARTLPFLIYFSWDIYRDPLSIIVFQISKLISDTLIFEIKIVEGDLYKYHMKNISRTAKFLPTWGLD
jgi:hypothetical protein